MIQKSSLRIYLFSGSQSRLENGFQWGTDLQIKSRSYARKTHGTLIQKRKLSSRKLNKNITFLALSYFRDEIPFHLAETRAHCNPESVLVHKKRISRPTRLETRGHCRWRRQVASRFSGYACALIAICWENRKHTRSSENNYSRNA